MWFSVSLHGMLYIACESNQVKVAQLLLNDGVTVDMSSNVMSTSLFEIAITEAKLFI